VLELDVQRTQRSGHATELAREAREDGYDLVIACGGDGTGNEVVNGLDLDTGTAQERPVFMLVPAGGTNVLCRALGLPNHPVKAARQLAQAVRERRWRPISLGRIDERTFLFAAGIAFDGALVRRVEQKRRGRRPSDLAQIGMGLGLWVSERFVYDARMTVTIHDTGEELRAGLLMCSNARPFTYVGRLPIDMLPDTDLERGGLDLMAPERVTAAFAMVTTAKALGLLGAGRKTAHVERKQLRSDVNGFDVVCDEPQPCQVDGEYIGERTHISFHALRDCVRMVW
jgi:diacylglycerol kinase family enzyme